MPLSFCERRLGHSATGAPTGDLAMRPACAGTPFLRGKIIAVYYIYIYRVRRAFCRASVGMTAALHVVRMLVGILPAPLIVLRAG